MEVPKIAENRERLSAYLASITDTLGGPNVSTHKFRLKNQDVEAMFCESIKTEYQISLKELKHILSLDDIESFSMHCRQCGNRVKQAGNLYCSIQCQRRSADVWTKTRQTCMEKYGVENAAQAKVVKDKIKDAVRQKYGVDYSFQAKEVKEKIKETFREKYGVDHAAQSEVVKDKIKATCVEKFGVEHAFQADSVKKKIHEKASVSHRKNKYPKLIEWLKKKKLEMLTSYEDYLIQDKLLFRCLSCKKEFEVPYSTYIQYNIFCEFCYKDLRSAAEGELFQYIRKLVPEAEIVKNCRKLLGGQEIDLYLPEYKLAFEYDGAYWHSSNRRSTDPNYHRKKTDSCKEKGITLLHIFDTEWMSRRHIVESIIRSKFGIFDKIVQGRKCSLKCLDTSDYREFLEENHLQGYAQASTKLGLVYENELVAVIGVGKSRFKKGETELIRFCTKIGYKVLGGLSKLVSYIGIDGLISYVDRRYFDGSGYTAAGFELIKTTDPGYVYIKGSEVLNRYQCQKHKLPELLGDLFDPSLTEVENMTAADYYQVYDCGMLKFRWRKKSNEANRNKLSS